ncbi:hypothetical protein OG884_17545 [Streptosporangium sp. NBC_01755]|nr:MULTISPECIES: hypothetical protein [unclassified Streptosporangium]WSA25055.1 hypothetical protein OIE13_29620 [Streptosporangium sp. NBC_01810]WSD03614.1 hypothetical protein OG884_17545 [Streptosporangium sp. NBC_01755]
MTWASHIRDSGARLLDSIPYGVDELPRPMAREVFAVVKARSLPAGVSP